MTDTAKLYGKSLYELASSEGLTEELKGELLTVRDVFRENPDYARLLSEPSIPKAERAGLLDQALGGQAHPYLLNFLKILCENGTVREFGGCAAEFVRRYNEDHNIAEAVVTSAVPLSDGQRESLLKKLEAVSGKSVYLTQKLDPQILGGLRVELEGKQLDGTLEGRLAGLRRKISEIIV